MRRTAVFWAIGIGVAISVAIAAQSVASPPVTAPEGALGFTTETSIQCDGSVSQQEEYNWFYTEGEGNFSAVTSGTDVAGHAIIVTPGFQEAAAISYAQDYSAKNGSTYFFKTLALDPHQVPNLHVNVSISFQGDPAAGSSLATFNESLGLAVISCGADNTVGSQGISLVSLCPWASSPSTESGGGYPATTEIIGADSSFRVTDIHGFFSESTVITSDAPFLGYSVDTLTGQGSIAVGFSAEVWEATSKWGSHDIGIHNGAQNPTGIYAIDDPPQTSSHASYSDHVTADGVWDLRKHTSYQSSLVKPNPFYQVP